MAAFDPTLGVSSDYMAGTFHELQVAACEKQVKVRSMALEAALGIRSSHCAEDDSPFYNMIQVPRLKKTPALDVGIGVDPVPMPA